MKIEVEIGLKMVIPELKKLPEYREGTEDYYNIYDLMVEVCYLFDGFQKGFVAEFSGEDDTFYIENTVYNDVFILLWERFLPIVNFSDLLEKCSISVDNNIDHDYVHEPEYELRREV